MRNRIALFLALILLGTSLAGSIHFHSSDHSQALENTCDFCLLQGQTPWAELTQVRAPSPEILVTESLALVQDSLETGKLFSRNFARAPPFLL